MMEIQPHSTSVQLLFMSAKITSKENSIKALGYLDAAANVLLKSCRGLSYGYKYLSELKPDLCLEIAKQRLMYSLNKSPMSDEVTIFLKEPIKANTFYNSIYDYYWIIRSKKLY